MDAHLDSFVARFRQYKNAATRRMDGLEARIKELEDALASKEVKDAAVRTRRGSTKREEHGG